MAQQRMYPTVHSCDWSRGTGYGTHTSIANWTDTITGDCSTYCDDLYGALDETNYGIARSSATAGQVNNGRAEFVFGDAPQNVVISSLTVVAYLRTSNAGTAVIDTTPTVSFFVQDSGAGSRTYQTGEQSVSFTRNRNLKGPAGSFQRLSYTWVTAPSTGVAWTRAQLVAGTFFAGFESDQGTENGSGIDATTGADHASLDWASVYVELETTPSTAFVEPIRIVGSHQLRLLGHALREFRVDVPLAFGAVEPGDWVWSSHPMLPWSPGPRSWENVPLYVLSVEDRPNTHERALILLDLRDQFASFWSPLQVTGVDAENSGLALWHLGGGMASTRNQVAYVRRPGDSLYQQVAVNSLPFDESGLLIQGGSDKNWLLQSTFSAGATNVFTSWSKTETGTGTMTSNLTDYIIDASGFQRSAKCNAPAVGDFARLYQTTASIAAGTHVYVRIWYKNDTGTDPVSWYLRRAAGDYWNNGTPGWQAGAVVNALPPSSTIAHQVTSELIDVGVSDVTLSLYVGLHDVAAAATAHVYAAEILSFTDGGSSITQWFRRDLLPTTTTAVTRTTENTVIHNYPDTRAWEPKRGFFRVDMTPLWSHADMGDSTAGMLFGGSHDVYYVRTDSTTGVWYFSNGAAVASFATSSGAGTLPVAGQTYTIAGRWTSADEDEHGMTGQAVDIWVDGVKGAGADSLAEVTMAADDDITIGNDPATTYRSPIDAHLKNLLIDSRCPTDDEMARM